MRFVACTLLLAAAVPPAFADVAVPRYVDETAASGLDSRYQGEWEFMVGGGAAVFDCDGDAFPDLFLAGGTAPAKFYRNASRRGGALSFTETKSGLEIDRATGAYPIDIDGDGNKDLVILRVGENVVMRGLGQCRFERANEAWGFDGGDGWSAAFAATWEKGETWPTLAVGNYIDRREEVAPWGTCTENWLHRPVTDGHGYARPLPLKPSFCPLAMLFTDWNRSGTPSLRVSNDREYYEGGQEQMWRISPRQEPRLYTAEEGWKYVRIWGMGIAAYDLDFDGYQEYFLTSMADNRLQALAKIPPAGAPAPTYKEIAFARGVTAHRPYIGDDLRPSTAWHTDFQDVNNDGLADLFIVKGNVAKMPDFAQQDPDNLLLQQPDGRFMEAGATSGLGSPLTGRGGALADFNLDGLLDALVVNRWDPAQVWRNMSTNAGSFVALRLSQEGPNRDAIGAWIEVKHAGHVLRRELTIGGGHAGGSLGWWHFGLGTDSEAELRVIWPDGEEGAWQKVPANRFYTLERGKAPLMALD